MTTTTARAVIIETTGGPEVMKFVTRTVGAPGPGEVRIRHTAIGLNFIDVYHRTGLYPLTYPHGLGMEAAGVIEAVGDGVTHLQVGQRAAYAAGPPGSYAEARVMPAQQICPIPDGIDDETAAAAMLQGMTVNYLFRRTTPIAAGDWVLMHAAAGGVGLIACQWARADGVRLIGTAGTDAKCDLARENGAEAVINYNTHPDFAPLVKDITGGKGVHVVMDSVGKDTFDRSLDCLRPLGMMISFGNASGPVPPFSIASLGPKGSLKVTRQTLFTHIADHQTCQTMAAEVFDMILSGKIKIRIGQRFALDQVAEAHRTLESRATTGSTILTL